MIKEEVVYIVKNVIQILITYEELDNGTIAL